MRKKPTQPKLFEDSAEVAPDKRAVAIGHLKAINATADTGRPITDETLDLPADMSFDDFREILRKELREHMSGCYLIDIYPGYVVALKEDYSSGSYSSDRHMVPYEITDKDDNDGDSDELNIKFGEAQKVRMVPKVITDEVIPASGIAQIIEDSTDKKLLRFRLPGPRANYLNANKRVYPRQVLLDAIERAKPKIAAGQAVSYSPHPPTMKAPDGSIHWKAEMLDCVARIDDWFMDAAGQTWIDRTLINDPPTPKGNALEGRIRSKTAVGTSMRALGDAVQRTINNVVADIATFIDFHGDDFVENPATNLTFTQAQVLTDSVVEAVLTQSLPAPAASESQEPKSTEGNQTIMDKTEEKKENVTPPAPAAQVEPEPPKAAAAVASPAPSNVIPMMDDAGLADFNEWRDERKAEKAKATVKAFLDGIVTGEEIESPTGKKVKHDLSRFSEDELKLITDACASATPETVESVLASTVGMVDAMKAKGRLAGMGFQTTQGGGAGQTVGHSVIVDEPQEWKAHVEKLCVAMDDYGRKTAGNFRVNEGLRKANQPIIDEILKGTMTRHNQGQAMHDSARAFLDDAGTVASFLQQPTITPATAALIQQIFWMLSWLPMSGGIGPEGFNGGPGSDAGIGENLRIPVETRPSGRRDLRVRERRPISTVHTTLRWLNFAPEWRRLAFELTKDAQVQLQRGAARYDTLARQLFAIAQIFAESIDLELANEHYNASDEFQAVPVTGETHVSGDLITNGTTLANMGYGSTVTVAIRISSTFSKNGNTYRSPIVAERTTRVIQEDGSIQNSLNTVLNLIEAKISTDPALVRGELNADGDIVDGPDNADATYAVDYENGVFVFNTDAGVDSTHIPTLKYSYATNFDVFDLGESAGFTEVDVFYNSLLRQIDQSAATMGETPRFRPPTMAVFSLRNAIYAESARQAASLFKPGGTDVNVTPANPNSFGNRSGIDFSKVNTPLRVGNSRILLMQPRSVKYGIQYAWSVEGPIPNYYGTVVGGNVTLQPMGSQFYFGQQNSVICTPVAFDLDGDNNIVQHNHPMRTIKLVGTAKL